MKLFQYRVADDEMQLFLAFSVVTRVCGAGVVSAKSHSSSAITARISTWAAALKYQVPAALVRV